MRCACARRHHRPTESDTNADCGESDMLHIARRLPLMHHMIIENILNTHTSSGQPAFIYARPRWSPESEYLAFLDYF